MRSKIGLQSQSGIIVDLGKILRKKPVSWKLLGNALNLGIARTIRQQSPRTFLVIRTGGNWAVDDNGFIQRYADEASTIAEPFQREGLCDLLEPPNEPVVQTVELAKLLNDRQVQYAQIMKARGYRVGAYNFSVGNPDYPLWPFLQDGIRASDYWLLLHEYGAPFMDSDPVNLALRHRKAIALCAPDVRAHVKVGITESGIDLGSIGSAGGYRRTPQPSGDRRIIDDFLEQLTWYDAELAKDAYVQWVNLFGYGMQEPWVGLGFDLAEVEEDRIAVQQWLSSGAVDAGGTNPPVDPPTQPPQGATVITSDEIKSAIPYLVKVAQAAGMGASVYGERDIKAADGKTYHLWMFDRGGVGTEDGKYGPSDAFYFDTVTYAISKTPPAPVPAPNPNPNPTPQPRRLTTADMPAGFGFTVEPYQPKPGEAFWGLVAAGGFKLNVGTQFTITCRANVPYGVPVTHAWDAHNHFWDTKLSDGNGQVNIVLGEGSEWTPGSAPPPDRVYVSVTAKEDKGEGVWPTPAGDVVNFGMPGGHCEGLFAFQLMVG
jgi:hypothetical protein